MKSVTPRISRLELNQELKCGLIGIGLQALGHLVPLVLELAGASTARLVAKATVSFVAYFNASRSSILAPEIYATEQLSVLLEAKVSRELNTKLVEELSCVYIWETL